MAARGPVPDVMTRPKPFTTAEMGRLPISMPPQVAPASPESGILPGEEQVTTEDVLRQLAPPEQAALQKKYDTGGHANTISYQDWLSDNFGELPPKDRAAAMKSAATSTERVNIGKDPTLPTGTNSALARSIQAAGKPLPEGREPDQYTPEQRRTMSRNVYNPEVPMTRFGGTFTHNPNGSVSERAPDPAMLDRAEAIGKDQGYGSPGHVAALAQAYNINAMRYGDDLDLLAGHVLQEHQRHEQKMARLDTIPNGMGGFRYAPNAQKSATARAAAEMQMTPERKAQFADTILRRFNNVMTPAEKASLDSLVNTPDGFTKMRALHGSLSRRLTDYITSRVNDSKKNYNLSREISNPRYGPGMAIRSLLQAVDENNPLALSVQQGVYGNQVGARDAMQMAMGRDAQAAELENTGLAMRGQQDKDRTLAAQFGPEVAEAMQMPPGQRDVLLAIAMRKAGVPEEQIPSAVQQTILTHEAQANPTGEAVQNELRRLASNEVAFKDFVRNRMRRPDDADALWSQYSGKSVPAQAAAGQAARQAWNDWASQTGAYIGGFLSGKK